MIIIFVITIITFIIIIIIIIIITIVIIIIINIKIASTFEIFFKCYSQTLKGTPWPMNLDLLFH